MSNRFNNSYNYIYLSWDSIRWESSVSKHDITEVYCRIVNMAKFEIGWGFSFHIFEELVRGFKPR